MNSNQTTSALTQLQRDRIAKNREEAIRRAAEKRHLAEQARTICDGPSSDKIPKQVENFQQLSVPRAPAHHVSPAPTFPQTSGFSRSPLKNSNTDIKPHVVFTFQLSSSDRFKITFNPFHMDIVNILKTIEKRHYDPDTRTWDFHISEYEAAKQKLKSLSTIRIKEMQEIPDNVRKFFKEKEPAHLAMPSTSKSVDALLAGSIDDSLLSRLFPYQRTGIEFGIKHNGCLLIGDEMGLGKSVQALGIARYYKNEWPLLIICPASVKYSWRSQIRKFLPAIDVGDIHIIEKASDYIPKSKSTSTIIIMSYDQMTAKKRLLIDNKIYVIIFDESHQLKDQKAQRTKTATELSKIARRRILISGTPALSRPAELFSQIRIIDTRLFPNYRQFAIRYCDGKEGYYGFEAKGATNTDELSAILQTHIMIRRLKKEVKGDLPEKIREIVWLEGSKISSKLDALRKSKLACENAKDRAIQKVKLMEYYSNSGVVKAPAVAEYVIENYFPDDFTEYKKVLIFGHHIVVLDMIGIELAKKGIKYIRIDGSTKGSDREAYCNYFQNDENVLVALLSLTAAGMGINLTAAKIVIFAELTWNPGTIVQAEDRAHRVGQDDTVLVQYLLARNTADEDIWPLIQQKVTLLGAVQISCESLGNVSNTKSAMPASFGGQDYLPITNFFKSLEDEPNNS